MIYVKPHAVAPESPANRDRVFGTRPVSRIPLRQSLALHLFLALAIGVATAAFHVTVSPSLGALRAMPLSLALLAACGLAALAWRRTQPATLEIGPDSFAVWAHNGARVAQGRLVGAAQWGTSLLALSVQGGRRRTTVLVASDMLDRHAFHTLAVRARCAAGR